MTGANETDRLTPYDELAPSYGFVSAARDAYLRAVDEIIVSRIAGNANSMLDVGSADGHRAMRIADSARISNVILVEPSAGMRNLCLQNTRAEIWPHRAEELPETEDRFSVITCLWNVLGHIETNQMRMVAAHAWDIAGALHVGCATAFIARPGMVLDPLVRAPDIIGVNLTEVAKRILEAEN